MAGTSYNVNNSSAGNLKKLLQVISHRGILSDQDLKQLCVNIFGTQERGRNDNSRYISEINSRLKDIDLTVRSVICELTGQKYWSLVSTVLNDSDGEGEDEDDNDDESKHQRRRSGFDEANRNEENESDSLLYKFTKPQMEYFKLICEVIIMAPTSCISSNDCINLVGNMEGKLPRTQAEIFLKQAIKGLWFRIKDGQIYMGARSVAELMPFFKAHYEGGLNSCPLCKQTIFYGHECLQCQTKCHFYCLTNCLKFSREIKCPSCNEQFDINDNTLSSFLPSSESKDEPSQKARKKKH